ncbi:hypothetical protein DRN74_02220 [Candidatus Micrarchaeota archaeon]|nr:MAG: hypothetical protein DRN74_02220 [Candidatus Micrarchaeota archaeon]
MSWLLYVAVFFVSLISAVIGTKYVIRKVRQFPYKDWDRGFLVPDFANPKKVLVPRIGGLGIVGGFTAGVLFAIKFIPEIHLKTLFASLLVVLMISIMAFFTDIFKIRKITRVLLPGLASLPLVAISAGISKVGVPLLGEVQFGIWYSLVLVPIGIMACSNLFNMLAGHNGLEAGTVIIASTALLTATVITSPNNLTPIILLVSLIGAAIGFLYYNWYPAKVFPGDVGTYSMAAVYAAAAITSSLEKVAVIAVMPQIIEFFLKARSKFKAQNFGKPDKKGRLHYDGKVYSLTHIVMKLFRPKEWQLSLILIAFQALFAVLAVISIGS